MIDRHLTLRLYRDISGRTHIVCDEIKSLAVVHPELWQALSATHGAICGLAASGNQQALAFLSAGSTSTK